MHGMDTTVFGSLSQQGFENDHIVFAVTQGIVCPLIGAIVEYGRSGHGNQMQFSFTDGGHKLVFAVVAVFQGGHYTFAMETSPVEELLTFKDFEDIKAGIVKWPMSVIRLQGKDPARIADLADKILIAWRGYTDESVSVIAFSDGQPHNTITPIARRRGEDYELDLVLRCNITTEEHPMGVFHPHADKHHIKKENIGLIEVMGLAVLPSRLKKELADLADAAVSGKDISADEALSKHADWLAELKQTYTFTKENALDIILQETGKVFAAVLEDAGVYKNTCEGRAAFLRFVDHVNQEV